MSGTVRLCYNPPFGSADAQEGELYYATLSQQMYVYHNNHYIQIAPTVMQSPLVEAYITQPTKKESRCEYCGCLYTNDEVICLHCGAPR